MITPVASVTTSSTTIAGIFRRTRGLDRRRIALRISAILAPVFILAGSLRANQSASLAWNPVNNMPVAGYAFYVGSTSGTYTSRFDVGTNTQITLTGLKEGTTNYFAVTAYNSARLESPVSSAVPYIVPGMVRLTPPPKSGGGSTVSFPVAVGHSYELQASVNLATWTNLWQTTVWSSNTWVYYQDPQSASFQKRFYRLIMQ